MEGNVCKTCGGNCMFCKVTLVVGSLVIVALAWTLSLWWDILYSKIAITVVALVVSMTMFCPCKNEGGANAMKAPAAVVAKPAAKAAVV
ncbi:MAG: hypothetical protein IH845_00380 [Nanoarchaeota archaeon]|nr:hypothetical protein [Nanoarchaeota archaeon]